MTVAETPPDAPALVHDILETAHWLRCGRSTVYELLNAGELRSIKIGRRRLVTHASIVEYVERLSDYRPEAS